MSESEPWILILLFTIYCSASSVQDGDGGEEDTHVSVGMDTIQVQAWTRIIPSIRSMDLWWKVLGNLKTSGKGV